MFRDERTRVVDGAPALGDAERGPGTGLRDRPSQTREGDWRAGPPLRSRVRGPNGRAEYQQTIPTISPHGDSLGRHFAVGCGLDRRSESGNAPGAMPHFRNNGLPRDQALPLSPPATEGGLFLFLFLFLGLEFELFDLQRGFHLGSPVSAWGGR